jgi:tetratricopeptide (TPR) repeat protein
MSYSADYIKRMIEQMGQFLLALRTLLDEDKPNQVLIDAQEGYRQLFGVDGEFILNAPESYIGLMTSAGHAGDSNKIISLADLLTIEGQAYAMKGDYVESQRRYCKALHVLIDTYLAMSFDKSTDHTERVDQLISLSVDADLPAETLARVFNYYERVGQFARAEDTLYELLDHAVDDDAYNAWADDGEAFYSRLLAHDDYTLKAGGLPRDEVREGLAKLTADP